MGDVTAVLPPPLRRGVLRHLRTLVLWGAVVPLGLSPLSPHAADSAALERGVKAAFLYKFIAYVAWPEGAFARPDAPVVLGVMGDDTLAGELADVVATRTFEGRRFAVRRVRDTDTASGVHILFVGRSESARLPAIAQELGRRPVLLVTETEGALERGSVINFVVSGGRVKFDIAPDVAERRGIKLSSRLLTVAQNVRAASMP